jgi:hypothetical protein
MAEREMLEPYKPCVIDYADSGISEFMLRDCAAIYHWLPSNSSCVMLEMHTGEIVGFAWYTKQPPSGLSEVISSVQLYRTLSPGDG